MTFEQKLNKLRNYNPPPNERLMTVCNLTARDISQVKKGQNRNKLEYDFSKYTADVYQEKKNKGMPNHNSEHMRLKNHLGAI